MKKISFVLFALIAVTACNKELCSQENSEQQEIVINVDGDGIIADVTTKTSAVTTMPASLYFAGTTGTNTSQTSKWASVSKTVSSNKINTGYYQTATATSYNYYLSNCNMSTAATGCSITADGSSIDAIAGVTKASTSTSPSVTLNHIFGRTGTLSASCSGYTLTNVTYKLKSKGTTTGTKGTYNIYSGSWSSTTALSETTITSSSDLYLIPGTYTLTISGTRTKGDFTNTFSGSVDINIVAGKTHAISATITGDPAVQIVVSTTLTAWSSTTLTPSISA